VEALRAAGHVVNDRAVGAAGARVL
jgi:hypothetical protein